MFYNCTCCLRTHNQVIRLTSYRHFSPMYNQFNSQKGSIPDSFITNSTGCLFSCTSLLVCKTVVHIMLPACTILPTYTFSNARRRFVKFIIFSKIDYIVLSRNNNNHCIHILVFFSRHRVRQNL